MKIKLVMLLALPLALSMHARVFVPQKNYWRYESFLEPKASTLWAYYSGASSKKAFDCAGKKSRAALADIYFNKANFLTSDVFKNSNPLIGDVSFSPRFTYKEQGVDIGYYGSWKINSNWSWGALAELPIKQITVKSCQLYTPNNTQSINFFGNPLSSYVQEAIATNGDQTYQTYAFRLDFLSKLPYACTGVGLEYPMVVYHDTDFVNLPLTISNVDTTDANNNPVSLLYSVPGTIPAQPFEVTQAVATTLPVLNTDGSRTGSDTRERVSTGDYTPLSALPQNQAQWWVVPTTIPVTGGETTVFPSRVIRDHVNEVLACLTAQSQNIFSQACINFCNQKTWGAGDLITQLFVTYDSECWWGGRLRGGFVFPTGKKINSALYVYQQPIGNNGHLEAQLGGEFIIDIPHFAAEFYFLYSHACAAHEWQVPTAFAGNSIKNIGLCAGSAKISWDSVSAGILADIKDIGYCKKWNILLGYQAFIKSHDHVTYDTCYGFNPEMVVQRLSSAVMEQKTARQTHTLQGQIQYNVWNYIRLDGGVEYTVAGKTAPVVLSWNAGLSVLF